MDRRNLSPDSHLPAAFTTNTAFQFPGSIPSPPSPLPFYSDRRFFSPSPPAMLDPCFFSSSPAVPIIPPSLEMEESVEAVEQIIRYSFKDKRLLEEALTHSSCSDFPSYQRLEFVGDMALGLAFTNYLYLAYPHLEPGKLSLLRAANVSTEKLARVALKHGIYGFTRRNSPSLDDKVKEFSAAVIDEDDPVAYGGSVKAPKVLADLVESVAAAIYVDVNFNLERLWVIFRCILEPIVTLEDLQRQPQPVTVLLESCQKHGKQLEIKYWRNSMSNITSVYVDGKFIASGSAEQKEISKLKAVKAALVKLSNSMTIDLEMADDPLYGIGDKDEIEGAKQKLHELCSKKKWPKPIYSVEKEGGPSHEKKFVCSAKVPTREGVLYMEGDEKSRIKDAENSAASFMIRALKHSNYL